MVKENAEQEAIEKDRLNEIRSRAPTVVSSQSSLRYPYP